MKWQNLTEPRSLQVKTIETSVGSCTVAVGMVGLC